MKKRILLLFLFFASLTISAQEVVSTQGDSYSTANANIDFTIGEVIIDTGTDGSYDLTQGFHQTNWNFLGIDNHASNFEAIVFPNPTAHIFNIRISPMENVSYKLYDVHGKLVLQGELSREQTPIQVSQLAPGTYSLTLNSKTQFLKTFKLIKTH